MALACGGIAGRPAAWGRATCLAAAWGETTSLAAAWGQPGRARWLVRRSLGAR